MRDWCCGLVRLLAGASATARRVPGTEVEAPWRWPSGPHLPVSPAVSKVCRFTPLHLCIEAEVRRPPPPPPTTSERTARRAVARFRLRRRRRTDEDVDTPVVAGGRRSGGGRRVGGTGRRGVRRGGRHAVRGRWPGADTGAASPWSPDLGERDPGQP